MNTCEQVTVYAGPKLSEKLTFGPPPAKSLKTEYGSLECAVEIVSNMEEAVEHIAQFGSGHTDVIVTENRESDISVRHRIRDGGGSQRLSHKIS